MTYEEMIDGFFQRLDALPTGDKAALKREAGVMLNAADGKAMRVFYRVLPNSIYAAVEDRWFAAACLYMASKNENAGKGMALEKVAGALISSGKVSDSTAHRIETLMDTDWDVDGYMLSKLSKLVQLIRGQDGNIDYQGLLKDLLNWNSDSQYVQRRWARAIYKTENNFEDNVNE